MGKFRRRQRLKSMVKGNKSRKKGRGGVREEQVRSLVLTAHEWEEGEVGKWEEKQQAYHKSQKLSLLQRSEVNLARRPEQK